METMPDDINTEDVPAPEPETIPEPETTSTPVPPEDGGTVEDPAETE